MKDLFGSSIRTRIMSWVLMVTGIILVAVIFFSYAGARRRLESDMKEKAMFLADGAARQIDAQLGVLQGIVHGMAMALEAQYLQMPFEQARAMQSLCLRENDGIYGVCMAFEPEWAPQGWPDLAAYEHRISDGQVEYTDLAGTDYDHLREDWFTLPKHLGRPVWSEPYKWNDVLMVTYSVPVHVLDDGERSFAGVITCDLALNWLDKMITDLPLGPGGYSLLMTRNGTYIAHPLHELVLNETVFSIAEARNDPSLREVGQRMVSGRSDIFDFVSFVNEDLSWLAFTPLQSTDWIMAALISREEMNATIVRLSHYQAAIGLAGLVLLCIAIGVIARSITHPIRELRDAANILAEGNLDTGLPVPRGHDEVAHLTRAFGEMRDHLKRYVVDLRETTAARERMRSELRIAHDIQMGLVPKEFPDRGDLDLFAVIEPAREVGGDFYDFFFLDETRMVVAIGDVSGKGVPAALFMAVTRSFLRSAFRSDADPARVLTLVNDELVDGNESCLFVTLFCAVLDLKSGRLHYANAGHNPPLLLHPEGRVDWISEPRGPIAGPLPGSSYVAGSLELPSGTVLLLYTDGVTEAMNTAEEFYSDNRLEEKSAEAGASDCRALIEKIISDIRFFAGEAEQSDDITMLALKSLRDKTS